MTATKQHLYPEFPAMPAELIDQQGGYYGNLNNPGPGTLTIIVITSMRKYPAWVLPHMESANRFQMPPTECTPPRSFSTANNQTATLGFRQLGYRRPEAKNLAFGCGINNLGFEAYPNALAFNLKFLISVSDLLADTYKVTPVVFPALSEIGALSQAIIERPLLDAADNTIELNGNIQPISLSKETESIFGSGLFFRQQLMKKSIGNNHLSWSMFNNILPESTQKLAP